MAIKLNIRKTAGTKKSSNTSPRPSFWSRLGGLFPRGESAGPSSRRFPRGAAILFLILFVLALVGGWLTLHYVHGFYSRFRSGEFNRPLLSLIVKGVNQAIAGRVSAASLEGDPLRELTLRNVAVLDPDGEVLIQAGRVTVSWSVFSFRHGAPLVRLRAEQGKVNAIKSGGVWNFRRLRKTKKKPGLRRPARLPRLAAEVSVSNMDLHLVYPPERVLDAHVTLGEGLFRLSGSKIKYDISEFQAAVENPRIGVNHLALKGTATSTEVGWDMRATAGEMITASSEARLLSGQYYTGLGKFAADFSYLEAAPDALGIFWPAHSMAVTAVGAGSLSGNFEEISFQARLRSPAGAITGTGRYLRKKKSLELAGELERFSFGRFIGRDYSLTDLTGQYQLEYKAAQPAGAGTPPRSRPRERYYHVLLDLSSFAYPSLKSFPGQADVELEGERYKARLRSSSPGTRFELTAEGGLTTPYPVELKLTASELDLRALRQGMPEAVLAGTLELSGAGRSLSSFLGRAAVTDLAGKVKGYTINDADLTARLSGGRISFEAAEGIVQGMEVKGTGWIEPQARNVPFNFDLDLNLLHPDDLAVWTKNTVSARHAAFKLNLQGNKSAWKAAGEGNLTGGKVSVLSAENLAVSGQVTVEKNSVFSGELTVKSDQARLPALQAGKFRVPDFRLVLSTRFKPSRPADLNLDYELAAEGTEQGYALSSTGSFSADTVKRFYFLELSTLALALFHQEWKSQGPAQVLLQAGELRIQGLRLANGEQRLSLDGPLQSGNLDLTLTAENFQLGPWTTILYPGDTIAGALETRLVFKGSSAAPRVAGDVTLQDFQYRNYSFGGVKGELEYLPERLNLSLETSHEMARELQVAGYLPLKFSFSPWALRLLAEAPMELKISAPEISGRVLTLFLPWLREVQGQINLSAVVQGTYSNPVWNGRVKVKGVKFIIAEWGLQLRAISGEAEIRENLVTVPEMLVRSGSGRGHLKGGIRLRKFSVEEMDLVLELENFRAMNTPDIRADINGRLTLKGDLKFPRIGGRLEFEELLYQPPLLLTYQGMAWEKEDPTIAVKGKEKKGTAGTPFLDRCAIQLQISILDTAKLRSSELNVRIGGELELKKPPAGFFLIFGKLTTKEGWVIFQGKPFRVDKGEFMFPAIPVIDPDLSILASYRVPDYITYIKIGGTLSQPTLEIYSEPPLDPADVLAVIFFGRPVSQLGEGERQNLAQTGGQLVTGYAASGLANSLTDALGLDALVVQTGDSPETSGIGLGKYLNERLYLFYYQYFGEERAAEFRLRYELRRNVYIEAGQDAKGQGGADVYITYPY